MSKRLKFAQKIKRRKIKVEDRIWMYPFNLPDDELDIEFEVKTDIK
jgi:hypothetical protein